MMSRPRRAQTTIVLPAPQVSSSVGAASIADVAGLAPALSALQQALSSKAPMTALATKVEKTELTQALSQITLAPSPNTSSPDAGPGLEVIGSEVRLNIGALPLAPEN